MYTYICTPTRHAPCANHFSRDAALRPPAVTGYPEEHPRENTIRRPLDASSAKKKVNPAYLPAKKARAPKSPLLVTKKGTATPGKQVLGGGDEFSPGVLVGVFLFDLTFLFDRTHV